MKRFKLWNKSPRGKVIEVLNGMSFFTFDENIEKPADSQVKPFYGHRPAIKSMYFKFLSFLKFLITSTNQHGVHSPFVYHFVTKCLYSKRMYRKSKTIDVLLKSISYFEIKKISPPTNKKTEETISMHFPEIRFDLPHYDLVYIDNLSSDLISKYIIDQNNIPDSSMLLIDNIHKSLHAERLWQQIVNNEKIMVTIDMFYCGAVFFRKKQVKEHFKIRI